MNINPYAWIVSFLVLAPLAEARPQAVAYTDEGAYLAALAGLGIPTVHEGFEDDAAWGGVRSTVPGGPQTAPSIHNLGLTWLPNNTISEITTGNGPARTGMWGFFQLPHGDWTNGIRDGWIVVGDTPLVAIGGWIETNTPFAKIALFLDGVPVDFGGSDVLDNQHRFFGAIDPAGFSQFEYTEQEATPDDWKYIFADDFTFAFGGTLIDCNENGVPDALDLSNGTSSDCNLNLVPDECEIDENSTAPGGPFFCTDNCDPDCNENGLLDECEVMTQVVHSSGPLSPIGDGFPQSFLIASPPPTLGNVVMDFRAYANLGGPDEFIDVDLNGVLLGTIFVHDGDDCPDTGPVTTRLIVPKDTFNAIVGGGDASIGMVASTEVDANDCNGPSTIELDVTLFVSSDQDSDSNGIPDDCEDVSPYCFCPEPLGPCNNHDPAAGCANSTGAGALSAARGTTSASADDLVIDSTGLLPFQPALLFVGETELNNGSGIAFGDGLRCAGTNVVRLGVMTPDPNGDASWGPGLGALGGWSAGETRYLQTWYRDPAGSPCGSGFNLSHGLSATFSP